MSDLLNKASLVVIPSGYKEDTVYSVVPSDGSGDLSFTRASNGTRINSAGLVEVCPWNLFDYSEGFNASYWNKRSGTTITADTTTAPNGTLTADTATKTSGDGYIWADLTLLPSTTYTISLYAKGSANLYFNAYWGTGSLTGSAITLTSDWQRLSFTFTTGSTTSLGDFGFFISATCNIWGAQLNIGSTAKPYFPTTDRLNVPRLTYQNGGGGCPSLLLEKQSTNLVSYSQDFSNAYWSKTSQGVGSNAVVTANYAISPDGTQNATRFVCNLNGGTSTSDRSWMLASFSSDPTTTLSIWIKLNSAGTKTFIFSDSGGNTKTISGTEWQRIDTTVTGGSGEFRIGLIGGLGTSDTLDCCIWGAQAEGGSYPTSYIPTTSSSATRVADACYKTGISSLIGQSEGVMFLDIDFLNTSGVQVVFSIHDSANNKRLEIWANSNTLYGFIGGSVNITVGSSALSNGRHKIALAYKQSGDHAFYIDGVQIGTNSTAYTIAALTALSYDYFGGGYAMQGKVNETVLFPTRLTNAELQSLTTL